MSAQQDMDRARMAVVSKYGELGGPPLPLATLYAFADAAVAAVAAARASHHRIKKGEPIPEWLMANASKVELVAGDDLIVIPSETAGYDVYLADPSSDQPMMRGEGTSGPINLQGAPIHLRTAAVLTGRIHDLRTKLSQAELECDGWKRTAIDYASQLHRVRTT